jgi:hypothetical protein
VAGYSGTPLAQKLGIKPGHVLYLASAPANYRTLVDPLPEGVTLSSKMSASADIAHLFCTTKGRLADAVRTTLEKLKEGGMIWVSWPKKASGVATDVTEDVIREVALPLGLVDVKVCAVDEVWSGLKLVRRAKKKK